MDNQITIVDNNRVKLADSIDSRINNRSKEFLMQTLLDLQELHTEKLYAELGFESMNVYLMERLNMSSGVASRYITIIEKLLPFCQFLMRNFSDKLLQDNNLKVGTDIELAQFIPSDIYKLYAISKLKSEWKTDLFTKGKVRLRGKWITLEDFARMPRQQVLDIIDAAMNTRRTVEEIKADVIPWKRYKVVVYLKMKKFQGDLQEIHESPSLPAEVRADLDDAIKGLDVFWDKYFPEVPEVEE